MSMTIDAYYKNEKYSDQIKTAISGAIASGGKLSRNDLTFILRLFADNIRPESKGTYYEAVLLNLRDSIAKDEDVIGKNVLGYCKIGKQSQGVPKRGNRTWDRDMLILEEYTQLTDKNSYIRFKHSEALKRLADESLKKFGRALGERAITNAITRARKSVASATGKEISLPDFD